jgi:aspartate racemase
MGPEATASFYERLIELTPARRDQDHLHVIIAADPSVPDRTAAFLRDGESPLSAMRRGISLLVDAGADLIAIPCNTAHIWIDELREGVDVPILDMIEVTARAAAAALPHGAQVAVLATVGMIESDLYGRALAALGLNARYPSPAEQEKVTNGIVGVKAGTHREARELLQDVGHRLVADGVDGIILGCTEIPLVFETEAVGVPVFDSLSLLARRTVNEALGVDAEAI